MARILVAEDDPTQRSMVKTILELQGHHVTEAEDGERALELLESQSFDAVLLDSMMPNVSGIEVLERMAELGETTPVIMVTAKNTPDAIAAEVRSGALEHLSKPYRVDDLERTVASVLSLTPEQRTRRTQSLRKQVDTFDAVADLRAGLELEDVPKGRRR